VAGACWPIRPAARRAADLIRDWRDRHQRTDTILFWHEGQIRAQLEAAVALFKQSLKLDAPGNHAWNLYAQATIAFITKDRPAPQRAHEELLQIALPDHIEVIDGHYDAAFVDGSKARLRWPPNIDVVEGLVHSGRATRRPTARPAATGRNPARSPALVLDRHRNPRRIGRCVFHQRCSCSRKKKHAR